ncbi:LLM class flavin-dependent oxidoreductase [Actinoplanes rectilineatus]|uniref:LLM class flavin-dependent oxidoreductase n=1 Tax=Actinoplanes rectilineatus TaxID=113571 RepID=UPI003CCBD56E
MVTSPGAFFGENFRRGGFLDHADRYVRAAEFITTAKALWDTGGGDFRIRTSQFDISGTFPVPRSPQGHPVILQAGDSAGGRDVAAEHADAIFSRHHRIDDAREFYRDIKTRVAGHGRDPDDLKIIPGVSYVLGDSAADAQEKAHHIRRQQVSPQTAILLLEQLWNRDLSGYDPEGPLPSIDPVLDEDDTIIKGRAGMYPDRIGTANEWRALAEQKKLSIRDLIIEVTGRQNFIGTPADVAARLDEYVQTGACDGFILVPHLTPTGLDDFVDQVVPLLQERGVFRTGYTGTTLRQNLGLR